MNLETEITKKHESYAMLGFSRITSSPPQPLFGSSIKHSNLIQLTIKSAEKEREFQKDYIRGKENLIQVYMSSTQFAAAITSMNIGDGIPCTLSYVKGDKFNSETRQFRANPPEIDFKKQAQGEIEEDMNRLATQLSNLSNNAKSILEAKGNIKAADKETLLKDIAMLIQEVKSNIPFIHQCFQKSIEKTVTEAKGEIDATFQSIREKLGDKAIQEHKLELPSITTRDIECK
jgi:hypothetical protein